MSPLIGNPATAPAPDPRQALTCALAFGHAADKAGAHIADGDRGARQSVAELPDGGLLALSPLVFHELVDDLSMAAAVAYLRTFEGLLDARLARIVSSITACLTGHSGSVPGGSAENRDEAETALLSLQASAAMAGATRLSEAAAEALGFIGPITSTTSPRSALDARTAERLFHTLGTEALSFRAAYDDLFVDVYPVAA